MTLPLPVAIPVLPSIPLPPDVQAVLDRATRLQTPCGDGSVTWHLWEPELPDQVLAPVVLLHGGSGSWSHWYRNIAALTASGRRVYAADMPGFGDSAAPLEGGDADVLPEPLEAGLHQLLGDVSCDLVGFSFGGLTAGLLAAQFPARVARLVLVGAPGLGLSTPVPLRSWRHYADPAKRDAIHRSNLAALMVHDPETITETALRLHVVNVERDRLRYRRLARTDALLKALPSVRCSVQAIYGSEDALYPGRLGEVRAALALLPGFAGMVVVPGAGHWVQFEKVGVFDGVLLGMLG